MQNTGLFWEKVRPLQLIRARHLSTSARLVLQLVSGQGLPLQDLSGCNPEQDPVPARCQLPHFVSRSTSFHGEICKYQRQSLSQRRITFGNQYYVVNRNMFLAQEKMGLEGMSAHTNGTDCVGPCQTSPQLQLYQSIIFATPVLFACLLLVLFCMLYMRRRRDSYNHESQARAQFATGSLIPLVVFYQGLSASFRQKLPTVPFDASREDYQCAVCLSEYQIDEKLQELPGCKHLFHISCIDEWLAMNTTCPICRTSLVQEELISNSSRVSENMREDHRRWEERVVSHAQDGSIHVFARGDSSGSSDSMAAILEITLHLNSEHAINIERS